MQSLNKFVFSVLIVYLLIIFVPFVSAVGFFSQVWNYSAFGQISPHALDSVGQMVYFGSAETFGRTNYLYAVNIIDGVTIWRCNTSLPVNYVSHFKSNNTDYIAAGTGGSTTQPQKSFVLTREVGPNNRTLWQSINLNSSVRSLGSAKNYTGTGDDVVAGLLNGTLLRLSGTNGSILRRYNCVGEVFTISELKNGSIIVGSREAPNKGHVYCLEKNGVLRWEMPFELQFYRIVLVKKFADVNGDGEPEVVAVFTDGLIHVLNGLNGQEVSPWPFNNNGDNVKDLLCTEDYTGDDFPDIICATENGNLEIINGSNATRFRGPSNTGYILASLQYMNSSFENGVVYSNKSLAVSLYDLTPTYYVCGINASDLALMKQFPVPNNAQAQNLFNIGNYTSTYTGDLIFSANNVVYNISGAEIIYSEFPSQIVLVILVVVVWFLVAISRREHL